jgi:hypothetical protein
VDSHPINPEFIQFPDLDDGETNQDLPYNFLMIKKNIFDDIQQPLT